MQVSFAKGRWSPKTQQLYADCWRDFTDWCELTSAVALPAEPVAVAAYISERSARLSTSSISLRLQAIFAAHKMQKALAMTGEERDRYSIDAKHPVIADAWADIKRAKGTASVPKLALAMADIKRIVAGIPEDKLQERAILLLGFASAMRRSEIVALDREDIEFTVDGLIITIRRSKTDKSGKGANVAIGRSNTAYCPVRALQAWLSHADISTGPIFRSRHGGRMQPRRVALVTKKWAKHAGFDPRPIAAHSLRRGCITSMHEAGIDMKSGMELSRHRTPSIYLGYVQAKRAAENPAVKRLAEML